MATADEYRECGGTLLQARRGRAQRTCALGRAGGAVDRDGRDGEAWKPFLRRPPSAAQVSAPTPSEDTPLEAL